MPVVAEAVMVAAKGANDKSLGKNLNFFDFSPEFCQFRPFF